MRIKVVTTSVAFGLAFAIAQSVEASTITFEADMNVPGYVPQDELRISDQFAESFGVTFGLDIDGDGFADPGAFPKIEQAGTYPGDLPAFLTFLGGKVKKDIAKPGFEEQLGQFFLKGSGLIINYENPVAGASGEIWDIDGKSQ